VRAFFATSRADGACSAFSWGACENSFSSIAEGERRVSRSVQWKALSLLVSVVDLMVFLRLLPFPFLEYAGGVGLVVAFLRTARYDIGLGPLLLRQGLS